MRANPRVTAAVPTAPDTGGGDPVAGYAEVYARSIADPERFWLRAADAIDWTRKPTRGIDDSAAPLYRWFSDGVLNTCHNALDRHVAAGHGDRTALIYDSPVAGVQRQYSYAELTDEVARFAGALVGLGVGRGDRVLIYLPMVPQAVIAMLACARIGAIHVVVFGGFAPKELAARLAEVDPKVLLCASCGIEPSGTVPYKPNVDAAIAATAPEHRPQTVVVLQRRQWRARLGERDRDWDDLAASARPVGCVDVAATDELYVLYTSGTTGRSKGVVRDNGGHAVALAWAMNNIFGIGAADVWWAASDVGWAVGHSCIVYGALLVGATTVLYEGKPVGTPDAGAFWRMISQYRINALFVAPTAIRAIRQAGTVEAQAAHYDLSCLRTLFLGGERLDPATQRWAGEQLAVPVIDTWWQTETGWPVVANPVGLQRLPIKVGSPSVPVPGYQVRVLDEAGTEVAAGVDGAICLKLPLPPGTLPTLWRDDDGYRAGYLNRYPGYYLTGDGGHLDADGYLCVMGRTDDIINVAGHRLSTGAFESVLAGHPAVAECVVIGVRDALKGQVPRGLVVLRAGVEIDADRLRDELVAAVRREIGAVAAFRQVSVVDGLPKNRSGKILRAVLRAIADGHDGPVPATIEDPAVLERLRPVLRPVETSARMPG